MATNMILSQAIAYIANSNIKTTGDLKIDAQNKSTIMPLTKVSLQEEGLIIDEQIYLAISLTSLFQVCRQEIFHCLTCEAQRFVDQCCSIHQPHRYIDWKANEFSDWMIPSSLNHHYLSFLGFFLLDRIPDLTDL